MRLLDKIFGPPVQIGNSETLGISCVEAQPDREPGIHIRTAQSDYKDGQSIKCVDFNICAVVKMTRHSKPKKIRFCFDMAAPELQEILNKLDKEVV